MDERPEPFEGSMFARPHYELADGDEFWVMTGHRRGAGGDEEIYAKVRIVEQREVAVDE
jgi:hypothetical protein